ncbi:rhomboid family intramembrane serine protease [Sediminibacillus halophilus]|uniref:Rhomboid protease GluP n=1 Tax=Sediminibacillus halophilus TaxID=482461 RepID=A0A1G9YFB4_9BACI|nr:rhomboid family intramembrane serine protease [Sediminibacillus halophilus]SDN07908.1 rhomboid protease GluP [Sediminibacillus halophilus]
MYVQDEYYFLNLAHDLVRDHDYELLHIDKDSQEIWLEKQQKDTSNVIRLYHKSFDWGNHLKNDMAQVIYKVQNLRKLLGGKKVKIHDVYIAAQAPVDDWESLKKPLLVKDKKPTEMHVYYLDERNRLNEKYRLYDDLGLDDRPIIQSDNEEVMERQSDEIKSLLKSRLVEQQQAEQSVFQHGRPLFTYVLLAVNVLLFFLLERHGSSLNTQTLIDFGAKYNPAILQGEWWRIISSMFLHIGFVHLLMNMIALFYLGTAVERLYGTGRFAIVYFLAGITGGLASFAFNTQVSAGASGAIFGLFGSLLYFGVLYKRLFFRTMGWNLLFILALNIAFGVMMPQIDNGAHIGGLLGGFLASAVVSLPGKKKRLNQLGGFMLYLLLTVGLLFYAMQFSSANLLQLAQHSIEQEEYHRTLKYTEQGLEDGEYKAELLFYRSLAHLNLDEAEAAIDDLEESLKVKPDFAEAHYNLALLYVSHDQVDNAKQHAEKALSLQPDNKDFDNLVQRLSSNEG